MMAGSAFVSVAVAGLLLAAFGAAVPHSTTRVYTGCYSKTTGTLRVID